MGGKNKKKKSNANQTGVEEDAGLPNSTSISPEMGLLDLERRLAVCLKQNLEQHKEYSDTIDKLYKNLYLIVEELEKSEERIIVLEEQIKVQQQKIVSVETNLERNYAECTRVHSEVDNTVDRKNNIIVYGLKHSDSEPQNYVRNWLKEKLDSTVKTNTVVIPLGKATPESPVPYLVKLPSLHDKIQIMKKCYKLAGSCIRVCDDLSVEQRCKRRELLPILKQKKSEGMKVYFRSDILYVNGIPYSSESK